MHPYRVKPGKSLRGRLELPGDKSIAHRSIIISAIASGGTRINNFPVNQDCLITLKAFKRLGVGIKKIKRVGSSLSLYVEGKGLFSLKKSPLPIFTGESGTTFRLLLGVLAGQPFRTTLTADRSLSLRPMRRVTEPLRRMGAIIEAQSTKRKRTQDIEEYPPITIEGGRLCSITYRMPVASAQVKSALLLAGLYAQGTMRIIEPVKTRDHTERMLKAFGADIRFKNIKSARGKLIILRGGKELVSCGRIDIPADISSASFFIVAATLLAGSHLLIKNVCLNPTRMGIIRVLKRMGADIKVRSQESGVRSQEPRGDILVRSSTFKGIRIKRKETPSLIDELPILMVAACFAKGQVIIEGVEELRLKETDRINSMLTNLKKMGANIQTKTQDSKININIVGTSHLIGERLSSFGDHRTAMSMVIAGLVAEGQTLIDDVDCIDKSFPDFLKVLRSAVK